MKSINDEIKKVETNIEKLNKEVKECKEEGKKMHNGFPEQERLREHVYDLNEVIDLQVIRINMLKEVRELIEKFEFNSVLHGTRDDYEWLSGASFALRTIKKEILGEEMTGLMTLRDLNLGWEGYAPEDDRIRGLLRNEAIKWVKKLQDERGTCKTYTHEETNGVIDFINNFFNLIEEGKKK